MPFGIAENLQECSGWATVKAEGEQLEIVTCHENKQDAIDQMIALSLAEDLDPIGEITRFAVAPGSSELREEPNLAAPEFMRSSADRGLRLHAEGKSGAGLRPQTVADARRMAAGEISEGKWRKIGPWIARHIGDLAAIDEPGEITPGLVAMLLWGGGSSRSSATRAQKYAERIVERLDARVLGSSLSMSISTPELRADPEDLSVGTFVSWNSSGGEAYGRIEKVETSGPVSSEPGDFTIEGSEDEPAYLIRIFREEENDEGESEYEPTEQLVVHRAEILTVVPERSSRSLRWVSKQIDERRTVAYSNLELRAEGENRLVGYAAVFDSPSEPMPFTEFVRKGAFAKTLNDGADVRLLIDHEGVPLARTRSGTMTLEENEKGLYVEASLDPANPDAQRILSAMRRGDLSQMSFAFRTIKDSFNADRSVRELKEVQLFDVSVVTFPAYEETSAELRRANSASTIIPVAQTRMRQAQLRIAKAKR
jgi:HK97 family phage prohead protease